MQVFVCLFFVSGYVVMDHGFDCCIGDCYRGFQFMRDIVRKVIFQLFHCLLVDQEPEHISEREDQDQQDQE